MKRIFLLALVFSMFAGAVSFTFSQDQPAKVEDKKLDGVSTDESLMDKQPTAEELACRADEAAVLELLGNMRDFRCDYATDTRVQAKVKERKLAETLKQINVNYKGKILLLQRVTLEDVIPETVGGLLDYLAGTAKETGKYKAKYSCHYGSLPWVEIFKTYPNESSVINLKKGSVTPVTGKICKISYEEIGDRLTIWID